MCWQPCQNVKLRTDAQTLCFVNQSYTCYLIYRHAMPQRQGWSCKSRLQGAYRQTLTRGFMHGSHDILHVPPQLGMTDAPAHVEKKIYMCISQLHSGQVYPSYWLHHFYIFYGLCCLRNSSQVLRHVSFCKCMGESPGGQTVIPHCNSYIYFRIIFSFNICISTPKSNLVLFLSKICMIVVNTLCICVFSNFWSNMI